MPPDLFFFLRIAVAILGLLRFPINFRIICFSSVKNVIGNLIGITLNLYIALGCMVTLTMLILLQEHGVSFHFFESSSISFIMFYSSQHVSLSPPWSGLFLFYFFAAILKGTVFFYFLIFHC